MPRLTCFLWLACLLSGCAQPEDSLLPTLREQLQPIRTMTRGYRVVNLDRLTNFAWDSVYAFHGEEGGEYVNSILGFAWDGPDVPNLHQRLLFVRQRAVVAYVDCNEEESVFGQASLPIWVYMCPGRTHGIARSQAKFAVFRHCDGEQGPITYPFIPLACLKTTPDYQALLREGCPGLPSQAKADNSSQESTGLDAQGDLE